MLEEKICDLEVRHLNLLTALKDCLEGDASKNEDLAKRHEDLVNDIKQIIRKEFGVEVEPKLAVKTEPEETSHYDAFQKFKKMVDCDEFLQELKEEELEMESIHCDDASNAVAPG